MGIHLSRIDHIEDINDIHIPEMKAFLHHQPHKKGVTLFL